MSGLTPLSFTRTRISTKIEGLKPLSCLLSFYYEDVRASAPPFTRTRISTKIEGLKPLSCLLSFYYEDVRASGPPFTRTRISTKIAGLTPLSLHCYEVKGANVPQKRGQSSQIFITLTYNHATEGAEPSNFRKTRIHYMCRGGRALVSEFKGLDSITTYKSSSSSRS